MTNRELVLALVRSVPEGLTDSEVRERTGIQPHQQVNQICRTLAQAGFIERRVEQQGRIVNFPLSSHAQNVRSHARNVPPARRSIPHAESRKPVLRRADPAASVEIPDLLISTTLFILPCSGAKQRGGRPDSADGTSVIDSLPRDLAAELRARRSENAQQSKLDESALLPAAERYTGTLYRTAGAALDILAKAGAGLLIISGGYGVVSPAEPIGWYDQEFRNSMWPNDVVTRCLAVYADMTGITTVIALLSATTSYARAFRSTCWPDTVECVLHVSPESVPGAMVKAPRAQGDALKAFSRDHTLHPGWTSSDGVGVQITRLR